MLKVKALCVVDDIHTPEVVPSGPVPETPGIPLQPTCDTPVAGIDALIAGKQNFVIESAADQQEVRDYIISLALLLVRKDALLKSFIRKFRLLYAENQKEFSFSLDAWSPEERQAIYQIFQEELCGLVESVHVDRFACRITGNLVFSNPARKFLTGGYMEIGVFEVIRQAVEELAAARNMEYKLYRNVIVSTRDGHLKNEFDVVIECQGKFYVVEVKSGGYFNDWGSLLEVGKTYNIVPHRLLLVDSYLTNTQAGRIETFCEYFVSNLENDMIRNKVIEMVGSDL